MTGRMTGVECVMDDGRAENTEVVTGSTVALLRTAFDDDLNEVDVDSDAVVGFTTNVAVAGSGVEC